MNEIYWITRLDSLEVLFIIMIGVPGIIWFVYFLALIDGSIDSMKSTFKYTLPFIFVGTLGLVFVPNKQDALLILGVGGTIDYIKTNETIKEIPDKCIDALDAWVSSLKDNSKQSTR